MITAKTNKIRVEFSEADIPEWACTDECGTFRNYVVGRLAKAGIPVIGGPLSLGVDFSKGHLESYRDLMRDVFVFTWAPNKEE